MLNILPLVIASMLPVMDNDKDVIGSSMLVTPTRALTAYHVVNDNGPWFVQCGSKTVSAALKAKNAVLDLAILSLDDSCELPVTKLAEKNPAPGEDVKAYGCPNRFCDWIMSGHVVGYTWMSVIGDLERRVIVTDAPVWFGNSGGGLVDKNGELVGICSQVFLFQSEKRGPQYTRMFGAFVPIETVQFFIKKAGGL